MEDHHFDDFQYEDIEELKEEHQLMPRRESEYTVFANKDICYDVIEGTEANAKRQTDLNCLMREFDLSESSAMRALNMCNWNFDRALNRLQNDGDFFSKVETTMEEEILSPIKEDNNLICQSCYVTFNKHNEGYALPCKHYLCIDCYSYYVNDQFDTKSKGAIDSLCPVTPCNHYLLDSTFRKFLPDYKYEKYRTFVVKTYVDNAFNLKWCTSPTCSKIIRFRNVPGVSGTMNFYVPNQNGSNVSCDCGNVFCSSCGEEGHQPLSCTLGAKWRNLIHGKYKDISEKWITLNTKRCPKCTVPIQKNDGCMHMVCESCHFEFCWLCLGEWSKHNTATGGFYKCNMYTPKDDPENTKIEMDLQKYTFYSERYFEHLKSIQKAKAKRKIALDQFSKLCKCFGVGISADFLETALDGIIDSRRLLLYTFPMAYFANFRSTSEKDVFEFQQGELAYHLEKLDEVTDHLQVRDTMKFRTKDDIFTFKRNVSDICLALGKYFTNMMEYFAIKFVQEEEKNEPNSASSKKSMASRQTAVNNSEMEIMDEIPEEMNGEAAWNCPQCTHSNSIDSHSCEKCQFNREITNQY